MRREADVVVIGAGAIGACTALHVARRGRRVVLVDRREPASQSSPRAAGLAAQLHTDDALSRIGVRSIELLERFAQDTGEALELNQTGSIKLARTETDAAQIEAEVERGRASGIEVEVVDAGRAHALAPWLEAGSATALWFAPRDLWLEPGDLVRAHVRAAERLGVTVLAHAEVTEVALRGGGVAGVVTARGTIDAPVVVDAAGAWSRIVGQQAGVAVPLWPYRHQLCVSEPLPGVDRVRQPTVRVLDARTYCRPDRSGGLLFGGYEPDPLPVDPRDQPPEFDIAQLALDEAPLRGRMDAVRECFPVLQGCRLAELRGGLPTMTPDGQFLVDRLPGADGFYVASGCNVGGLSTSPALGEHIATWIATGERPDDLAGFRLDRFGPAYQDEARLREACRTTYASKYSTAEVALH